MPSAAVAAIDLAGMTLLDRFSLNSSARSVTFRLKHDLSYR